MCNHNKDEQVSGGGEKAGTEKGEDIFDPSAPPVFVELLLRMIEQLSDDIVSWSIAGDSFIIKQLLAFEAFLPAYYGHAKFSSFTRQLNYYGFRRVKRTPSPRLKSTNAGGQGAAVDAAATTRGLAWEEVSHPLFHRGRRDLLAGIRRHKDGERLKLGKDDVRELDMLNSLRSDVDALSGGLKTVNGKLESIMSLLSDVAGGQHQAAPNTTSRGGGGGGGGGGGVSGFEGGNVAEFAAAPPAVVHGGSVGFGGGGQDDGGIYRGGQDGGVGGAPSGYFVGPPVLMGHQQQGLGHYPVYPPPFQNPSLTHGTHQVPYSEALPPLAEALATRASGRASPGPSRQQHLPHNQPM